MASVSDKVFPVVPDWLQTTPCEVETHYWLTMICSEESEGEQCVDITREEFIALKEHLAEMRGIKRPKIERTA